MPPKRRSKRLITLARSRAASALARSRATRSRAITATTTAPAPAPATTISTTLEPFSRCNFINTEINHDLYEIIKKKTSNNPNFKEIVALNLDEEIPSTTDTGCNNKTSTDNILDDDDIVEKITRKTRFYWSNISENVDHTFEPLLMDTSFSNSNSLRINGGSLPTIMRISKNNYNKLLLNLFKSSITMPTSAAKPENIYFIIDVGDDLIDKLKKTDYNNYHIQLNIIHSVFTIGDSASKTRPNSPKYVKENCIKSNKSMTSHSWLYENIWDINSNNKTFMSKYKIKSTLNSAKWKISQEWYLPPETSLKYFTQDAHIDNNRTIVIKNLSPLIVKSSINQKEKTTMNINFQKKRSGDYLQILAAKKMPEELSLYINERKFKYCKGPHPTKPLDITGSLGGVNYYYNRTYFVTNDWPAMSYAIYNKVNCIMIVKNQDPSKAFILRIKFN
jgi:hypothetical protein